MATRDDTDYYLITYGSCVPGHEHTIYTTRVISKHPAIWILQKTEYSGSQKKHLHLHKWEKIPKAVYQECLRIEEEKRREEDGSKKNEEAIKKNKKE